MASRETVIALADGHGRSGLYGRMYDGVRAVKSETSAYNGSCVELSFDPRNPGRMLLGDSKTSLSPRFSERGARIGLSVLVADVLFEGLRPGKNGEPGKFTYEALETSTQGGKTVTTAPPRLCLFTRNGLGTRYGRY